MTEPDLAKALDERLALIEKRLGIKTKEQLEKEAKGPDRGKLVPQSYSRRRHP